MMASAKDQGDYDAPYVEWQGEGAAHGQNIHYLHGALHLFDAGYQLQKYTWVNTGKALVDQANEALKEELISGVSWPKATARAS